MTYFCSSVMDSSDIISIIGIVINSVLAIWLITSLQKNLANKRYLKDHIIEEIKDLRNEYKKFLNDLYIGKLKPKQILPWFKLMNIKVKDTMDIINSKYHIDKDLLKNYQVELRNIITEKDEFNENFKENKAVKLSESSLRDLIIFQQKNNSKFNDLIINVNDKK